VPQVTGELALTLAAMKLSGFNVTAFVIRDLEAYKEAAALLAPYDIHVFHIEHEWSLHELSPAKIGR